MANGLLVQRLRYTIEATKSIDLEQQPGSALRGALFHALLQRFCVMPKQSLCATCELITNCPVAALVAPLRDEQPRGRDIPRPFVIRPPLRAAANTDGILVAAGDQFHFEFVLIGNAIRLFPYVALSSPILEANGLGRPQRENAGKRGKFIIREIVALAEDGSEAQRIYTHEQRQVAQMPTSATPQYIQEHAAKLSSSSLSVQFLTPTRLIADKKLVHTPQPEVLVRRLAERLDALEREYAPEFQDHSGSGRWREVVESCQMSLAQWNGNWIEARSFSTRQQRSLPISGFVGQATFAGDISQELRELLAWGELLHAGKDVVKGNGWYQITH